MQKYFKTQKKEKDKKAWNCRNETESPLKRKDCIKENIIYEEKSKTNNQT